LQANIGSGNFLKALLICWFFLNCKVYAQYSAQEKEMDSTLSALKNSTGKIEYILQRCSPNKLPPALSIKYSVMAVDLAEKRKPSVLLVDAYEVAGNAYWFNHNYYKASEYYFKQLRFADSLGLKRNKGRALFNIGWIKCLQQESFKDRYYLLRALKIFEEVHDTASILEVYNGLAGAYGELYKRDKKYLDSALFYFRNLVYFSESIHRRFNIVIHANYADFLMLIGKYSEAKKYLLKCREVALRLHDSADYAHSMSYLGKLYAKTDSVEKARQIYEEIIPLLQRTGQVEFLSEVYLSRSNIYRQEKMFEKALEDQILYKRYDDSIVRNVFKSNVIEKEIEYEIEKRENNIRQLEHQNEISAIKNRHNKYIIFGLLFIAGLVIFITINLFRSNKAKQAANRALNEKNQMIEEQKKKVEERNLDITNSINYARRIQEAILPPKELKYKLFPDAFVLFQPKDIVSGDFYWFAEKNGRRIIAAIDCTGHGVPGAFMSMIGNTFLNEAIYEKGLTKPSLILDDLRDHVISSLKQTDVIDSAKDGMDMALLSFNDEKNTVEFAGANNPLWLIRNGECMEFKADKKPIGYYRGLGLPFTNTEIELKKGDALYIFTDGFADQFGGSEGKKFKYRALKELLISIQHLDMLKQEEILIRKFSEWKGELEQVDDLCIIGIRV
jgi:serine phosphatase RsbU (regulator of sigma subunit)